MMRAKPTLLAMDLEGILIPEIWIAVAEKTGIEQLRLTTRDIPDYDRLMRRRLQILREHHLTLSDIQAVIGTLNPLEGAREFVAWARTHVPLVVLTDSYYEFTAPLLSQLNYPTAFCNTLSVDADNNVVDYHLRQKNGKYEAVKAFQGLGFRVIAVGDSYNDLAMLGAADVGILFRPPANVVAEFPQYPVFCRYDELQAFIGDRLRDLSWGGYLPDSEMLVSAATTA